MRQVVAESTGCDFMPTPDVDASETLHRQIGPGGNPIYWDADRNPPVHQTLFLPTKKDTDGLSFIRGRFRTPVWSAHRIEQSSVRFRLAALQALKMQQLALDLGFAALSYSSSADGLDARFGEPYAHCTATEINRADYDSDAEAKIRIKEWALGTSRLIGTQDVIGPFNEPTSNDPYRPLE